MSARVFAPAPIRKSTIVNAPRDRAFDLFTGRMTEWWFPGKGIGQNPFKEITLEPRRGGRWFERAEDGAETNWGEVLLWDRPGRVVLAWRINASWKFDPDLETVLEITFEEISPGATRVSLEHRNLERLGEAGRRSVENMDGGWAALLKRFADLAGRQEG
jgi:uncharacterized protein YndB with AHSA1/START domain